MSDKPPTTFLRRIFGASEPSAPPLPDPVSTGPAPIGGEADLETPSLRQLWLFLEAKRGARAMLSRADIDPGELKSVLPRVGLVEVHRDPLRFRIRLAGTSWRSDLGFEPTGMWLDDWPHATQRRLLAESWGAVVEGRHPVCTRRHAVIDGVSLVFEAMILPLSPNGETINMLLTISAPWRTDASPTTVIGAPGRLT
jgi:hypothetical protein